MYSIFISAPPKVIADRFLKRLAGELKLLGGNDAAQSLATYSTRLATMMTVEATWRSDALYAKNCTYDLKTWDFGSNSTQEVLERIYREALGNKV